MEAQENNRLRTNFVLFLNPVGIVESGMCTLTSVSRAYLTVVLKMVVFVYRKHATPLPTFQKYTFTWEERKRLRVIVITN